MKKINYESPLAAALKTLNKPHENEEIRVCDNCGVPMIWTFFFAYKERYCLNCGSGGGMMGTGTDVELTDALKFESKVVKDIWKTLCKHLIPCSQYTKGKCKKCVGANDHRIHLSKSEKFRDKTATEIMQKLNEGFAAKREIEN